jgi:hypothetical protein
MTDTNSQEGVKRALRNLVLDFQPLDGNGDPLGSPLRARYGGANARQLMFDVLADNTPFPSGILRLINQHRDGAYNGERITADLEIMLYERNAVNAAALEADADVIEQAFLRYKDRTSGLIFSRQGRRDTLPPSVEPESRGMVQIRLVFPLVIWPRYLTRYATLK